MYLTPKLKKQAQNLMLTEEHLKSIIDLLMKGLSINDIADHLKSVYSLPNTYKFVKDLVIFEGKHAKRLNRYYDSLIRDKLHVIEVDEIYQGRNSMFLGVVHKDSTYLLAMNQCSHKNLDSIVNVLHPVLQSYESLSVVITDGLPTYNEAIQVVAESALHLKCHVHAYRDVYRKLEPLLRRSRRAYTSWKRGKDKVKTYKNHLSKIRKMVKTHEKRLSDATYARDSYYEEHNIKKYSKKAKWSKERTFHKTNIGQIRAALRTYKKHLKSWHLKLEKAQKQVEKLQNRYWIRKTDALQSSRLVTEFKLLLDCDPKKFDTKSQNLVRKADSSPYSIAKYLQSVLKYQKGYFADKIHSTKHALPPNRVNTNTIESVFGRYRLFFDHLRTIKPTEYSVALFDLLRLKHNLNGPYTGPNKQISPIKRLNVGIRYKNFIECLFSQKFMPRSSFCSSRTEKYRCGVRVKSELH